MISEVALKDGNKGLDALAGKATTGIPLGTWASFEKDYAPNPEWLEAGTTFDANAFPALAMYLGGTKVPERYDHSRPSEYEVVTISSSSANPTRIEWDCDITIQGAWNDGAFAYINGSSTPIWGMESNSGGGTTVQTGWISLKKGDTIWGSGLGNNYQDRVPMRIRYYKHPMFIKATPTSSNSDYQGTLQAVMQYIRNMNSYSTEEKWTGGYWIDGKPIYRKCYTTQVPYTSWISLFNLQDIGINMDTMVSVSGVCVTTSGLTRPILANDQGDTSQFSFYIQNKNAFYVSMRNNDWVGSYTLIFEYTKTV